MRPRQAAQGLPRAAIPWPNWRGLLGRTTPLASLASNRRQRQVTRCKGGPISSGLIRRHRCPPRRPMCRHNPIGPRKTIGRRKITGGPRRMARKITDAKPMETHRRQALTIMIRTAATPILRTMNTATTMRTRAGSTPMDPAITMRPSLYGGAVEFLAVAAVFTLAVIGTAGALGYRALFGREISGPPPIIKADPRPSKIVPDKKETASAKLINDRVGSGDEKLVPREEQPIEAKAAESFPAAAQAAPGVASAQTPPSRGLTAGAMPPAIGGGVIGGEPKKIHTIVIHPDQTAMAGPPASLPSAPPQQPSANLLPDAPAKPPASVARTPPASASEPAPPRHQAPRTAHAARTVHPANAPLSLDPNAGTGTKMANVVAAPAPIAPRAAPSSSGKYAVQLSSRRSQSEAETAFRGLKAKFPSQLGSRQSIIRKVDLGKKGVYYRAMVGPFATSDEANQLCSKLKAAGGSCFVQRI